MTTAVEFDKEMKADKAKATKKYDGKLIEIIGEISAVSPRPNNKDVVVFLHGAEANDWVMVLMVPEVSSVATRLSRKQKVKLTAKWFVINFVGYKLEELDKSTLITVSAADFVQEFAKNAGEAVNKYNDKADIIVFGELEEVVNKDGFTFAKLKGDGKKPAFP